MAHAILADDGQLFRLIPQGRVNRRAFPKSLWSSSSFSLARCLSGTRTLSLLSMQSAGPVVTGAGKSSALLSVMNVNASPLACTSGANYTDKPSFLDFPSPRLTRSSLPPTPLRSPSLSLSACLTHGGSWGTWQASLVCPGPLVAENECRNRPPPPSLPALDFQPSSHYWWSARHLEYKHAEIETSHFPVRNYTLRSFW